MEDFAAQFDLYLESEKRLYGEVAGCDWWIDCFVWTFTPSFPGMYAKAAELFFKHWPLWRMGWVCEALEIADSQDGDIERELDLLTLAMTADPTCYLAHYLTAMAFYDMRLWRSALPYFDGRRAAPCIRPTRPFISITPGRQTRQQDGTGQRAVQFLRAARRNLSLRRQQPGLHAAAA